MDSIREWKDSIAAFGAAYQVWFGPKNWTGNGQSGADGGVAVRLYPKGGADLKRGYIFYYEQPACVGCILDDAAQYFPEAMKEYNADYNDDGKNPVKIPKSIRIKRLSRSLITYTLPVKSGLLEQGVAKYRGTEDYFSVKFVLPVSRTPLSDFLLSYYVSQLKD